MPCIKRFPQCRVVIHIRDHNPPHFHMQMNDGREAWVRIENLEIIQGKVSPGEIPGVLNWAGKNLQYLQDKFQELQQ